jgi:uncharacterized coiled-coil protein SlyX
MDEETRRAIDDLSERLASQQRLIEELTARLDVLVALTDRRTLAKNLFGSIIEDIRQKAQYRL